MKIFTGAYVFLVLVLLTISVFASLSFNSRQSLIDKPYAIVHIQVPTGTPTRMLTITPTPARRCFDGTNPGSCCSNGAICTEQGFCIGLSCRPPTGTRTPTRPPTRTPTGGITLCNSCSNICIYGSYGGAFDSYCSSARGTGYRCCRPNPGSPTPVPRCSDGTAVDDCCPSNKRYCRRNYAGSYACIGGTTDCVPRVVFASPTRYITPTRTPTRLATRTRTPTPRNCPITCRYSTDCSGCGTGSSCLYGYCVGPTPTIPFCDSLSCPVTTKYEKFCGDTNKECVTTIRRKTCSSPYQDCSSTTPSTDCYLKPFGRCSDGVICENDSQCPSGYRCKIYPTFPSNNYCYN